MSMMSTVLLVFCSLAFAGIFSKAGLENETCFFVGED